MEPTMFNPDTADRALAPCVYPVEELCLDSVLAGVMFNGELQIEIDETGNWYIESVTATNAKGVTQVYRFGHPIFEAASTVVLADERLCDLIYKVCVEHAEW
jgi:hypothetical protein